MQEYRTNEGPLLTDRPVQRIEAARPRPIVTQTIIGLNVLIFVLMVVRGVSPVGPSSEDLLRWGADFGPLTLNGQWWRLFTSIFLHFGIIHLGLNMYVFHQIGNLAEALYGRGKYLFLYLFTGVMGNIASLFMHPLSVGAGASGAIFGVYGAFLGFLVVRRSVIAKPAMQQMMRSMTTFLGINLVYGLMSPNTDLSAHIGGLVAGFLLGCYLTERPRGFIG